MDTASVREHIAAGQTDFPCANSWERKQVHDAAAQLGWRSETVKTTAKLEFSCFDWELYGSLYQLFVHRDTMCQETRWYNRRGLWGCDGRYCSEIPKQYRKRNVGTNYDDDQMYYVAYYTYKSGVKVTPIELADQNKPLDSA